jgi:alkaline phosphatase
VDKQVPDSAGTATAYLTGVKGNFETIGVNANVKAQDTNCNLLKDSSVPSILKWAVDAGKYAGIVTTARITHATPAAAYAHSAYRDWECDTDLPKELDPACKDIARQLIEDEPGRSLRVILGGGRRNFLLNTFVDTQSNQNGRRKDANLIEKWLNMRKADGLQSHQYKWINSTKGLYEVASRHMDHIEYLFGLFNYSHMSYEEERDHSPDGEPSLADMTTTAIRILSKGDQGFVLLVEGGRIDHAHHDNMAGMALRETVSLDQTIEAASKMVNMEETLIVVTADHAHTLTINGYPVRGQDILGLAEQNDTTGIQFETLMYGNGPGHASPRPTGAAFTSFRHPHHSAVHLPSSHHSGEDVAVYSDGPYAHLFRGLVDQTFVAHVMSFASCTGNYNASRHCLDRSSASHSCISLSPIFSLMIPICLMLEWRM